MDPHFNQNLWSEEDAEYELDEEYLASNDELQGLFNFNPMPASQGPPTTSGIAPTYMNPLDLTLPTTTTSHLPTFGQAVDTSFNLGMHPMSSSDIHQGITQTAPVFYHPGQIQRHPHPVPSETMWPQDMHIRRHSFHEDFHSRNSTQAESSSPRRSTIASLPPRSIVIPADPPTRSQVQGDRPKTAGRKKGASRIPRPFGNRPILPLEKNEEGSTGKTGRTLAQHEVQALRAEAEGVSSWGWRLREEEEAGPTFGNTQESQPVFDERGNHVAVELHGTFEVSRLHAMKISDDGGPIVHELQKRNIFQINDMAYTLDSNSGEAKYLTLRVDNVQKPITRMFMKLVGKKSFGDSENSTETPLETRGKARQFKPARLVEVFEELRYQKTDNGFSCRGISSYGDRSALPEVHSESHIEFKHATSGNKTTGYWRLQSQSYYRLALQLWAYTGDSDESPSELSGSEDLIRVAESRTNLLLVRGRPPGGREAAAERPPKTRGQKNKAPEDKRKLPPPKKQKKTSSYEQEPDEAGWLGEPSEARTTHVLETGAPRTESVPNSHSPLHEYQTARRYNTRNNPKRTYEEKASVSNEEDVTSDAEELENPDSEASEYDDSERVLSESEGQSRGTPGQACQHSLTEKFAQDIGNEIQDNADDKGFQQEQYPPPRRYLESPPSEYEDLASRREEETTSSESDWEDGLDLAEELTWFEGYMDTSHGSADPDPQTQLFHSPLSSPPISHHHHDAGTIPQTVVFQSASMSPKGQQWDGPLALEGAHNPLPLESCRDIILSNSNSFQSQPTSDEDDLSQDYRVVDMEARCPDKILGWEDFFVFEDAETDVVD